jgi:RNA polymerase sigma factor (sigma-70 family)
MDENDSAPDPLAALARSAVAGDRRALDTLCRELEGPIYRLALRMLGHPEDARDAAQEILLQIVTHLAQFRGESRLLTWAYQIATRRLLRTRARIGRGHEIDALAARIDAGLAATEPGSTPTVEQRVAAREVQLACTQAMLLALSAEERMAIVLAELLGADDATGAALCEISIEAYRKRLSRARAALRPILAERCGLADPALACRCERQARAKELAGIATRRWTHLPVIEEAHAQIGAIRRLPAVFAFDPPIAPPAELWAAIRASLPGVLGDAHGGGDA